MPFADHSPQPLAQPDLSDFLGGKKILIVDDEADIRRLVSLMLSKRGVASVCVRSTDDALDVLREYSDEIGLVLLDLSVPNSEQTPPLERIKQRYPSVPVIVITGLSPSEVTIDSSYSDSVGFLRKPFLPSALYDALGKRRARKDSGGRKRRRQKRNSKDDYGHGPQ